MLFFNKVFSTRRVRACVAVAVAIVLSVHPLFIALADDAPPADPAPAAVEQTAALEAPPSDPSSGSGNASEAGSETLPAEIAAPESPEDLAPEALLAGAEDQLQENGGTSPSASGSSAMLPDILTESESEPSPAGLVGPTDEPGAPTAPVAEPGGGIAYPLAAAGLVEPCSLSATASSSPEGETATTATSSMVSVGDPCPEASASSTLQIINQNQAAVENVIVAGSDSGSNTVQSSTSSNVTIATGQARVYANVINVLNTNSVNSDLTQIIQNFNQLNSNIALNQAEDGPLDWAQGLMWGLCGNMDCQNISSFLVNNQNDATLTNNVLLQGNSGHNSIQGARDNNSIRTGDAWAVVNILNIVNANLVNSRWTIASINVFGDWTGDLVLPSNLYFQKYFSIGSTPDSLPEAGSLSLEISNSNDAEVVNNVNVGANSGNNRVSASSTPSGDGGMASTTVATGNVTAIANVQNTLNTNIINGLWFLGMVNTFGSWSGGVYSLPDEVTIVNTPTGMVFLSSAGAAGFAAGGDTHVNIQNTNQARITNNVTVLADTGNNSISGGSLSDTEIVTGNSMALANILNFVNTNLVNSSLQIGMVNIFGNWQGNVVFGYPDLSVRQFLVSDFFPAAPDQPVRYGINYSNLGRSVSDDAWLEWQFDPGVIEVTGVTAPGEYEVLGNKVRFRVGRLAPAAGATVQIEAKTLKDLALATLITTVAQITAAGPEQELSNNVSTVRTTAAIARAPIGRVEGTYASPLPASANGSLRVTKELVGTATTSGYSEFKVTVYNDGNTPLRDVIMIDEVRNAADEIVFSKTFVIGGMAAHEQVAITYELDNAQGLAGDYTNTARAQGRNGGGGTVTSGQAAAVPFRMSSVLPDTFPEVLFAGPEAAAVTTVTSTMAGMVKPRSNRPPKPEAPKIEPSVAGVQTGGFAAPNLTDAGHIISPASQYGWVVMSALMLGFVYAVIALLERRRQHQPAPESVPHRLKTF